MARKRSEYDEIDRGTDICGALTRRGTRCKGIPVKGRTRCRMHGGTSKIGMEHHTWQGKGYSKSAPDRLGLMLENLKLTGEYIRLEEEIHLLRARLNELLEQTKEGETPGAWRRFLKRLPKVRAAILRGESDRAIGHLEAMQAVAENKVLQDRRWDEIKSTLLALQKLTDSERKYEETLMTGMSLAQYTAFLQILGRAVGEEIEDPELRQKVAMRMRELMSHSPFGTLGLNQLVRAELPRGREVGDA